MNNVFSQLKHSVLTISIILSAFSLANAAPTEVYDHLCGAPDSQSIPGTTIIPGPMTVTVSSEEILISKPYDVKFPIISSSASGSKLVYIVKDSALPDNAVITIFKENNLNAVDVVETDTDGQHAVSLRESFCKQ